jgi:uncharacterized protein HemY
MENNNNKIKCTAMLTGFAAGIITALVLSRKMRRKTGKWAYDMRKEVMNRVQETKDITQEKYNQIIDELRPRYEAMKDAGSQEMEELIGELKSHWQNISQEAKKQIDILNRNKKQEQPQSKG